MNTVGKPLNSYQKCVDACLRCFQTCHEYAALCLREPDVAQGANHIGIMLECIGFCQETACLMTMNVKHVKEMYQLCTTVYEECAVGYARFKDEHCQQCTDERHKRTTGCKAM